MDFVRNANKHSDSQQPYLWRHDKNYVRVIFIMGNCILKPAIAVRAVLARGCRRGFKGE